MYQPKYPHEMSYWPARPPSLTCWTLAQPAAASESDSAIGAMRRSVRRAILVHELPLSVDQDRHDVVVRVAAFVAGSAVSDLEVDHVLAGLVDESVAVPRAFPEAGAHSR